MKRQGKANETVKVDDRSLTAIVSGVGTWWEAWPLPIPNSAMRCRHLKIRSFPCQHVTKSSNISLNCVWGFPGVLHARSAADISLAGDMERKTLARASSAPAGVRLRGCARPGALPCIVRSSHSIKSPGCKAHQQVVTASHSKDSSPCGVRLQLQCPT